MKKILLFVLLIPALGFSAERIACPNDGTYADALYERPVGKVRFIGWTPMETVEKEMQNTDGMRIICTYERVSKRLMTVAFVLFFAVAALMVRATLHQWPSRNILVTTLIASIGIVGATLLLQYDYGDVMMALAILGLFGIIGFLTRIDGPKETIFWLIVIVSTSAIVLTRNLPGNVVVYLCIALIVFIALVHIAINAALRRAQNQEVVK